jgi:hypothetical protein
MMLLRLNGAMTGLSVTSEAPPCAGPAITLLHTLAEELDEAPCVRFARS